MELVKNVSSIEIPTNKVSYNKKNNVLSIEVLDFMFVGIYKKSARISKILDDLYTSLGQIQIERSNIYFVDFVTGSIISESEKLNRLKILKRKEIREKKEKVSDEPKSMRRDKDEVFELEEELYEEELARVSSVTEDVEYEAEKFEEEEVLELDDLSKKGEVREKEVTKVKKRSKAMTPPPGAAQPAPKPAAAAPPSDAFRGPPAPMPSRAEPSVIIPEEPQPTVYEINMGLQYYSVMMEQRSYLFYVYFSHQELKIVDEEGKTVYKTTVKIVTTKKEPPVLDLKIEGEGFEVHPILGKVEVKKDAVNPPVMIFSIMPIKSKTERKKRKESERRFLNVYIEFEEQIISHTILSIIVQPKYFRLELGPFHLNISKKTAVIVSFISILTAGISLAYMLLSIDASSSFMDYLSGFAPGLGSIVFFVIFLYTLLKEGIYPLKEKISAFLNFDQTGV
ncbi:MAG: hypothetical protein ACFFG0_39750, partial [Candidatus Thorarchaeota archaeon]